MNKLANIFILSAIGLSLASGPARAEVPFPAEPSAAEAEQDHVTYTGTVIDADTKEPLIGASVFLSGTSTGAATDIDGNFSISIPAGAKPVFEISYISYETLVITPKRQNNILVELSIDANLLDEVQVIAYGAQRKTSITGAISSVNSEDLLKSPSGNVASALTGALSGVSTVQTSGQPGADDPDIFVRGSGSLSAEASKPLVLVDGVERSFFQMDPNEIESITVLKDAASTAVFGVRGANGVILVTTKRGEEGRNQISLSSSFGLTQPLRHLEGVGSYDYARIYTDAQRSDDPNISDQNLIFSPYVTEKFRRKSDPLMFPDTDWDDYIFKDLSWQTQHNITMNGGSKKFRYFVSLGYLHQDGIMKEFDLTYNANYTYNRYNYRGNVDIDLTNTTNLKINLAGILGERNEPNTYGIWEKIMWCTPFSSPGFADGHYIINPTEKFIPISSGATDGLSLYYNWGHTIQTSNTLNMDLQLTQKLDFITKGLSLNLKGAYNSTYTRSISRTPTSTPNTWLQPVYKGYFDQPGMDISDPMYDNTVVYMTSGIPGLDEPLSYGESTWHSRNWYLEGSLNYARTFGDHEISGLFLYNQSKTYYPAQYREIPMAYVGYVGRLTYNYKKRYLVDFNVGYNGSENFAPGKRYGFFPAGSVGWVISEEPWMKNIKFINFLKIRASYGLVGNDKYSGSRFLYLNGSWTPENHVFNSGNWGSWQFGDQYSPVMLPDAIENTVGNPVVTWEKVRKQNYGIDMVFFRQQLSINADLFFEHRYDILSKKNTLPSITDISLPLMNLGVVDNHGYELAVGWTSKVKDFNYYLKANMSFSRNKIIYMDEVVPNYLWMAQTGLSTGLNYGYKFDRFLNETDFDADGNLMKEDINGKRIPSMSLANPRPGDVLYKDLNNDGKVDGNDCTYFGYGSRPEYVAGFIGGFNWKGFGMSMQWTGAWNASRVLEGLMRLPFGDKNSNALLTYLAEGAWTPENQEDARFPRISRTNKMHNNMTASDLWLMDASYLRLKTAEISYTISGNKKLKKAGISSLKVYLSGYNLLTLFSELEKLDIDPEGNTNGIDNQYPNSRIYNIGFNISF